MLKVEGRSLWAPQGQLCPRLDVQTSLLGHGSLGADAVKPLLSGALG